MKYFIIIVCIVCFSKPVFAESYDKYCEYGEKTSKIYILSHTIFNNDQSKADFLSTLGNYINTKENGDRLTLISTSKSGLKTIFDECLPGCPSGFFTGCNKPVSLKHKKGYEKSLKKALVFLIQGNHKGNLFQDLKNIQINLKKSEGIDKFLIASSMVPDELKDYSKKEFDKHFVKAIQSGMIDDDLPNAEFFAVINNSELNNFWDDIFAIQDLEFNVKF